MRGGGKFQLEPGQWTDDTSLALCIASSLIATGSFDLRDQLERFLRWRDAGEFSSTGKCFGIGQQTLRALLDYNRSGQLTRKASSTWRSGNGSLMRLAPIPLVFAGDLDLAGRASAASSITTHPLVECREACAAYGRLIAGAVCGWSKVQLLDESRALVGAVSAPAVQQVLAGSYLGKSRDEISSTGYVVDTMEAALWAFMRTDDFRSGALLAVNLGHDSDTVGAVYGQLAGAHYGFTGIPAEWREQLYELDLIVDIAEQLHALAGTITVNAESATYV